MPYKFTVYDIFSFIIPFAPSYETVLAKIELIQKLSTYLTLTKKNLYFGALEG